MKSPQDDGSHSSTATPLPPARGAGAQRPVLRQVVQPAGSGPGPLANKVLGRCRLIEQIGAGRTAWVYKAHYDALDDVVAVKILRDEAAAIPDLVEKFHTEARVLARIDNENVLKIYDAGTQDHLHYMVVELLEGEEILDLIQREERIEVTDALRIVRQAANGLAAAHSQGLIHRDVKPQNLFLLEDGTVKVMDFGLAASLEDGSSRVGTPHYMAPEVCESGQAGTASDVYALGITLFHLLTGQPPYAGKDVKGILQAHIQAELPRPERFVPDLPRPVSELLRQLCKRDPLVRPTSLQAIEALDRIGGAALRQKDTLKDSRRRRTSRARAARAQSPPVLALVLGAVAVVVLLAVMLGSDDDPPPAPPRKATGPEAAADSPPANSGIVQARATQAEEEARAAAQIKLRDETEAREAWDRARQYAIETWKTDVDTEAIIEKYRYVSSRWPESDTGKEAKEIVRQIKAKEIHPHPERTFASADAVQETKAAWEAALPQIKERVALHDYLGARELVPAAVSDASGQLTLELEFWRLHLSHLERFKAAAARAIPKLPESERMVRTAGGQGPIQSMDLIDLTVKVGSASVAIRWADLKAKVLANLALLAFREEGAEYKLLRMAFAYAHRLEDAFWEADLELGASTDRSPYADMQRTYSDRWNSQR